MTSTIKQTDYKLYIGGEWVDSNSVETLPVVNPATEEVVAHVPQANRVDMVRAIDSARASFDSGEWRKATVQRRAATLSNMADIVVRRMPELVELNVSEAGAVRSLSESAQIGLVVEHLRDMAERVLPSYEWVTPMLPRAGYGLLQGAIHREPIGVAGLISAYNFPFYLSMLKLIPALAAGCSNILKPSPYTPLEAFVIAEIADEAGIPAGVVNVVTGDVDASVELTTNPKVDMISFTGSDAVGKMVYAQATSTLKKVVLELGGKSANIICDDADLERAAQSVVSNLIVHSGQVCASLSRTIVHRSRQDELIQRVTAMLEHVRPSDPTDAASVMGPLISAAQRAKVEALIEVGKGEGATVVAGGGRPAGLDRGYYLEPTVFAGVRNSMRIAQEEFFGPVNVIIPFDDDDEAIEIANDSPYGLSGAVWAKDPARAYRIACEMRTGEVLVNGGIAGSPLGTFGGGYKQSGLGTEFGRYGLEEYLNVKSIHWPVAPG